MADQELRKPGNVPGPVFVDEACIWCYACVSIAPAHFDDPDGEVVCVAQPQTPEELERCSEAMEACPVEAIGTGLTR